MAEQSEDYVPTTVCSNGHGPYLYFCPVCHEEWERENPEKVAKVQRVVEQVRRAGKRKR